MACSVGMLESQPNHESTDMELLTAAVKSLRQVDPDRVPDSVDGEVMGALEHTERAVVELALAGDQRRTDQIQKSSSSDTVA